MVNSKPLKRRNPDNPKIREYTEAIERGRKNLHVVYQGTGEWKVKHIGSRSSREGTFRTKDEAFSYARRIARDNKAEVFIHGQNDLIQERRSYADDPRRPHG